MIDKAALFPVAFCLDRRGSIPIPKTIILDMLPTISANDAFGERFCAFLTLRRNAAHCATGLRHLSEQTCRSLLHSGNQPKGKPLSQPSDVWIAAAAGSAPSSQNQGFSAGSGSSQGTLAASPHAARATADAGETVGIWLESDRNLAGI